MDSKRQHSPNSAKSEYRSRFGVNPLIRSDNNARSVTIKQLKDATKLPKHNGRFVLDNSQVYTVTICGRLTKIDQNESHTDYKVHDGTADIAGRIWQQTMDGTTHLTGATLGAYYKFVCNLVTHADGLLLQTLKAKQVKDHNEITLHMLSAIHQHCDLQKLRNQDVDHWTKSAEAAKKTINTSMKIELDKEAIVTILSDPAVRQSDQGATDNYIMNQLHAGYDHTWNILTTMLDEGSVYNTVDYHHFKLADEN